MDRSEFYAEAEAGSTGPLQGVRILEATNYGPGPMCGMVLCDYGAESIKIDMPGSGDPIRQIAPFVPGDDPLENSCWHLTLNRAKKGITLDIRTEAGQALFRELAAKVDIVIESFTPGTMAKWHIGYEDLIKVKPDLIYVAISAFGQFGPLHTKKGFDPHAQAMGGMMSVTGERDGRPLRCGFAIVDNMCAWQGAMAAMAALHYRKQTGCGQFIDASLADVTLYASDVNLMGAPNERYIAKRMGNATLGGVPINSYLCRDKRFIFINAAIDPHWVRLCKLMGREDMIEDPRFSTMGARSKHLDLVDAAIGQWAASVPLADALRLLDAEGVTAGPIMDFDEIINFPHYLERESIAEVEHPRYGTLKMNGVAPKFSLTPAHIRGPAPRIGEHNTTVYAAELGLSAERIQALQKQRVI
jgi:crotonobetainyl-CoA:carnitine CoA-transferase CaiB-like acyl-CoA transferase